MVRFDLKADSPKRFLPEFSLGLSQTTRPDPGDISRLQLVTTAGR